MVMLTLEEIIVSLTINLSVTSHSMACTSRPFTLGIRFLDKASCFGGAEQILTWASLRYACLFTIKCMRQIKSFGSNNVYDSMFSISFPLYSIRCRKRLLVTNSQLTYRFHRHCG